MREYKARGKLLEENLGKTVTRVLQETFSRPDAGLMDVNLSLRDERSKFELPFCLMLYASWTDEMLFKKAWEASRLTGEKGFREALSLSTDLDRDRCMLVLMRALDKDCGAHLVMLERGDTSKLDGPVRLNAPDNRWFEIMSSTAELAQAFIVIGKLGDNVIREVRYLSDAGLRGRILIFTGTSLIHEGPSKEQTRWSLGDISSAIRCAAESPVHPPDRAAIARGY